MGGGAGVSGNEATIRPVAGEMDGPAQITGMPLFSRLFGLAGSRTDEIPERSKFRAKTMIPIAGMSAEGWRCLPLQCLPSN